LPVQPRDYPSALVPFGARVIAPGVLSTAVLSDQVEELIGGSWSD